MKPERRPPEPALPLEFLQDVGVWDFGGSVWGPKLVQNEGEGSGLGVWMLREKPEAPPTSTWKTSFWETQGSKGGRSQKRETEPVCSLF